MAANASASASVTSSDVSFGAASTKRACSDLTRGREPALRAAARRDSDISTCTKPWAGVRRAGLPRLPRIVAASSGPVDVQVVIYLGRLLNSGCSHPQAPGPGCTTPNAALGTCVTGQRAAALQISGPAATSDS
jgi:hypothetical protein